MYMYMYTHSDKQNVRLAKLKCENQLQITRSTDQHQAQQGKRVVGKGYGINI